MQGRQLALPRNAGRRSLDTTHGCWRGLVSSPGSDPVPHLLRDPGHARGPGIDVAVFHLALEAGKGALDRRSSLRTFFIVDRRVVVDEAFDHARKIATCLLESTDAVIREVAARLAALSRGCPSS